LRGAPKVFEYPMIDRDPVPTWVDGRVALLGDAAHVMYPVGSNGASQAIVDARVLGAALVRHGVTPAALQAYDQQLCEPVSALVLRNRGAGPFGLLGLVDERCGGVFDDIDAVIPAAEREAFMARYKVAAGFAIETLNAAPPTSRAGQGSRFPLRPGRGKMRAPFTCQPTARFSPTWARWSVSPSARGVAHGWPTGERYAARPEWWEPWCMVDHRGLAAAPDWLARFRAAGFDA
jgi:hypothetical protein